MKGFHGVLAATLMMAAQSASAAQVTVRVVNAQTLMPVTDVAVCLGSEYSPQAFAAARTDAAGEIVTRAPGEKFILSVASAGHGNYSREYIARDFDIIYYVALDGRDRDSRCLAPVRNSASVQGKDALKLVSVNVLSHSHHAGTVDVSTRVDGVEPTHIRVSTQADFGGARWMPYRSVTRHAIEAVASTDLYVQVKRLIRQDENSVEAVSSARIGDLHWN